MSRPSSLSQRPLTLTEELEKLEQSITLTLQGKQTMNNPPAGDEPLNLTNAIADHILCL